MDAERPSGFTIRDSSTIEVSVQPRRQVLCPLAYASSIGQAAEREGRVVAGRHNVRRVARTPDLDEGWVLPRVRRRPCDTGMDGVQGRSWNAVLQARPRGTPEGIGTKRKPLVKGLDRSPVREDLQPRQVERAFHHGQDTASIGRLMEADGSRMPSLVRGVDGEQQLRTVEEACVDEGPDRTCSQAVNSQM
jgi:hypothetical protein